jgi:carboxymethylenebutenolidase
MGERVGFASNGQKASGYLARPAAPGPGVVVIQEWWGLVPHIQDVAERFAREGFVALAPDLYHGRTTKSPDEAGKMMMSLKIDEAARDIDGAIAYLAALPDAVPQRVGIIGFCMGGALSLYSASRNPRVGVCVVFYGIHPNVKPDLEALSAPVLGIYAGRDTFTPPAAVAELDRKLTGLGKRHEFHNYPDADHAFFNDTRPQVYNATAAADAWEKTIAFMRGELRT